MRICLSIAGAMSLAAVTASPTFAFDLMADRGPTLLVLAAEAPVEAIDPVTTVSIETTRSFAYTTDETVAGFPADLGAEPVNPPLPSSRPASASTRTVERVAAVRSERRVEVVRARADAGTRSGAVRISSPLSPIIGAFN